jgi:hypothetical protein
MTCFAGKPEYECAKYVRTSTGLATSKRMAVSLRGFMSPITLDRMDWLRPIRSVRDSPVELHVRIYIIYQASHQ